MRLVISEKKATNHKNGITSTLRTVIENGRRYLSTEINLADNPKLKQYLSKEDGGEL